MYAPSTTNKEFAPHPARTREAAVPYRETPPLSLLLALGLALPLMITYGLTTRNEMQVTALILGLIGAVVVLARPFWGLIFFVGLLYIRPEESIPALAGLRLTLGVSFIALVGMWYSTSLNRERFVRAPINTFILGFGLVAIASTLGKGTTSLVGMEIAKLVILVYLTLNLVRTPDKYQAFVTAMTVFTGYLALYSIYLFMTGQSMLYQGELARSQATGIFNDPNDLAATLVPGMALALTRFLQTRGIARWIYLALTLIMVGAVLLTNSRGGMLALMVVLGGCLLAFTKKKALGVTLAAFLVAILLAMAPSRMTNFDVNEASANDRFHFWQNGVEQLMANPITGVGFGGFADVNEGMTAHNSFVLAFAELGLTGYFFWLGCMYYAFRKRPEREITEEVDRQQMHDLLGARLALIGFLAACFWISRTYVPVLYLLMVLPYAQQVSHSKDAAIFHLTTKEKQRDWLWIGLICIGSIVFIRLLVFWLLFNNAPDSLPM